MVAQEILVLFVEVRILLSQPKPCNSRGDKELQKIDPKNGTETRQLSHSTDSLYGALLDLCERKKMSFANPIAYKDYIPATLNEGAVWYISFYVKSPLTGKLQRQRLKFNRIESVRERRRKGLELVTALNRNLALGWNPLEEKIAPRASVSIKDAVGKFLESKKKEVEANSVRSYSAFINTFLSWLKASGRKETASICSVSPETASRFLSDIDAEKSLTVLTYNNYLRFMSILFRWLQEHGYVNEDPFSGLKPKKVKRYSKKRRILTDDELSRLWEWLSENNPGFLRVGLLCYCCLMRPKEIMLLRCSDIDLERQIVNVRAEIAKNDHDSVRTIPDAMMKYFRTADLSNGDWFLCSGPEFKPGKNRSFPQRASDYWGKAVRPALGFGDDVQLYSLKDTGITNLAAAGVPVSFIQQQADHSSLAMTSIYCRRTGKATEELKGVDILNVGE